MCVTASYTHLNSYRKHIICLHMVSKQIEFLSDPNEFNVATSGWHGIHDWAPMCRAFMLRQFRFLGQTAQFHHDIMFQLHDFSARHNIWRYTGYMVGSTEAIAEIIMPPPENTPKPSRPPPGQGPSPARLQCTPLSSGSTTSGPSRNESWECNEVHMGIMRTSGPSLAVWV